MRVHIYSQELEKEVKLISKVADTGIEYYGIQFMLASSERLHNTPEDDDRSAVTFWVPEATSFTPEDLAQLFEKAAYLARQPDYASKKRKANQ